MRRAGEQDPQLAREALAGLSAYERAPRPPVRAPRPEIARVGGAALRDHGGNGPPVLLVPSLINPPSVLDLDADVSLTAAIARMNRRVLLLDWGPAADRMNLDVSGHIERLLVPLIQSIGEPAALVGYCLGGTMAIAAAGLAPCERVATLAAPWHFSGYPAEARAAIGEIWTQAQPVAEALGVLPMEVLQAAFWSLDPARTVAKFARFGRLDPDSPEARRFVALEDWANEGEPLPLPAARELMEDLFADDRPGSGQWAVGGRPARETVAVPALHMIARRDRIAPAATAPAGARQPIDSGHVGMVVGSTRTAVQRALAGFLDPLAAAAPEG